MDRPVPQPRREEFEASEHGPYDEITKRFRMWFGGGDGPVEEFFDCGAYFGMLLNSPPMAALASRMGSFFRDVGNHPGRYSHADREFIDQVLASEFKSNVVQNVHLIDAVKSGVRLEAIIALREGRFEDLNEDEALLNKYIRQVVNGTVDKDTYDRMGARMGKRGLVEYTGFIMWLTWIMRMMQAFDTGTISEEEVDQLVEQAKALQPEKEWHGGAGAWHPAKAAELAQGN